MGAPEAQVTQSEAVRPVHVVQLESQDSHSSDESAYVPSGHVAMHWPWCRTGVLPEAAHDVHAEVPVPLHVAHVASHVAQVVPLTTNWPGGHVYPQVLEPASYTPPEWHAVHLVGVSTHLPQVESHAAHVLPLDASANLLAGHALRHAPPSKKRVLDAGSQETHAIEPSPSHSPHELWQAVHLAMAPVVSAKESPGHSATHSPLDSNGVAALEQDKHSLLVGPLQVPHELSQETQTLDALAYFPVGVQSPMHVPASGLEKGCVEAHEVHSASEGPEHVAHDASHVTHVSEEVALPPLHVHPPSMAQSASQRLVSILGPSQSL